MKSVALEACQEIRHGLDDNAIGKMGLIHGRPKMLKVTGQEVGRSGSSGCEKDGLVFFGQTNRNWRWSRLRNSREPSNKRFQARFAMGIFSGDISLRFLDGVGTCQENPRALARGVEEEGRLAVRIMSGREQLIGVEE